MPADVPIAVWSLLRCIVTVAAAARLDPRHGRPGGAAGSAYALAAAVGGDPPVGGNCLRRGPVGRYAIGYDNPAARARKQWIWNEPMAVIELRRRIKARPDVVWQVISDMSGLALMAAHVSKVEILEGEGRGLRRRVYDQRGRWWVESCTDWQEGERYTMAVDSGDFVFPCKRMEYTWGLTRQGEHVTIAMRFDYSPRYGPVGLLLDRLRDRHRLEARHEQLLDAWVHAIQNRDWSQKITVGSILDQKGRDVFSVTPELAIAELASMLRERRIGCALVLDGEGGITGVASERDVVNGLAARGAGILEEPVAEIMTRDVIVCAPEDDMMQIMSLMTERRIRHLPVVENETVVGVVSIGDVVKTRIAELETESEALREAIAAGKWHDAYRRMGPAAGEFV
jgi:CBS domain-containing protein